jgi:hypothetical protein
VPGSRTWPPTRFVRFVQGYDTSVQTAQIVTDAGIAYVKALGNKSGPHPLACELVGTRLARWFGLRTFEDALLVLTEADEIPFHGGGRAEPGPAFVTRGESGQPWDGDAETLRQIDNPEDVSRLVVFDKWVLNWDRCPPDPARRPNYDNVFLSAEGAAAGRFLLKAMDHTHCLGCRTGELTQHTADIDQIRDERVYGLFPGFRPWIKEAVLRDACAALR